MDFGEYKVTVQDSHGMKVHLVVHAHSDEEARQRAEQATTLKAVSVKRES